MKTQDQIKELKQISIEGYLANKGIYPVSKSGECYWYLSPLRNEKTASFSVDTNRNTFADFGGDSHNGGIIDLVMLMDKVGFPDACKILEGFDGKKEKEVEGDNFSFFTVNTPNNNTADYKIRAVKGLQHPALIRYVESRKISFQNASKYLNEIHYTNSKGKYYFAVGYEKDSGGYVVRNECLKDNIHLGQSGIKTFAVPNSKNVCVFEGMWDFLSACEFYKGCPSMTTIILNSLNNLDKALSTISQYEKVFCYLDNDDAGRKAINKLKTTNSSIVDKSDIYGNFNDFNDFLISNITIK